MAPRTPATPTDYKSLYFQLKAEHAQLKTTHSATKKKCSLYKNKCIEFDSSYKRLSVAHKLLKGAYENATRPASGLHLAPCGALVCGHDIDQYGSNLTQLQLVWDLNDE